MKSKQVKVQKGIKNDTIVTNPPQKKKSDLKHCEFTDTLIRQ